MKIHAYSSLNISMLRQKKIHILLALAFGPASIGHLPDVAYDTDFTK